MQFPYVKQLRDKDLALQKVLAPSLKGVRRVVFDPIVPSPAPLGYRTSSKLVLGENEFGQRRIGLFEKGSKTVAAIPGCPVHHSEINKLVERLWGDKAPPPPAPFYQHSRRGFQAGRCKFVTVRFAPEAGVFAVVLSHTGIAREVLERWASSLKLPQISLYEATLSSNDGDLVLPHKASHLSGPREVPFTIAGMTFHLGPLAFYQANASLTPAFITHVTEGLEGDELLDLYGGFGAYTFRVAGSFRKIHLVDANPHAIDAAKDYADRGGVKNVLPSQATVEAYLKGAKSPLQNVTHAIANPPRGGLSPETRQLLAERLPRLRSLTYVSCNPETLARDIRDLAGRMSFTTVLATPFDMFPQTAHVETVVRLVKAPKPF